MSFINMSTSYSVNTAKYTSTVSVKGEAEGHYCYLYRVAKDSLFNSASLVMEGMAPFDYTVVDKNTLAVDSYAYIVTKVKYDPSLITLIIPPNFWYYMNNSSGSRLSGTVCNAGFLPGDSVTVYSYTECNSSSDSCHHTTGAWYGIDGVITGGNTYHNHSGSHSETFTVPDDGADHVIKYSYNDSQPSWDSMTLLKQNKGFNPFKDDLGPLWKVENGILKPNIDTTELEALRAQVASLTNQLNAANQTISEKNTEISNLNSQINTLNTQIAQLTTERDNLQEQVNTFDETVINLRSEISILNSTIASKNSEIEVLKGQIAELQSTITNLNNEIKTLKETIYQLENGNDNSNQTITDLNNTISNLRNEINDYILQISNLNSTISQLNREIELLKSQINNSGSSNNELLEKLNIAERELDRLNNEVLQRIKEIETRLDSTNKGMTVNTLDIEEMKSSLIKDITAALGTPRFGIIPLPLAKQAIATSGELLSDCNTGHVYFKNGDKVVSKTIELEDDLNDLIDFSKTAWVAVSVDKDNHYMFTDNNIVENSNNSFTSSNNIIELEKLKMKYSLLTTYTISVKLDTGKIDRVYFKDENNNEFDCILRNASDNSYIYRLESSSIGNVKIHPVIELATSNTNVKEILIYKDNVNNITEDYNDNFGGPNIDKDLIDPDTIINKDNSFTLNPSHPIRVTIPSKSLKTGLYTLILRVRNNSIFTFKIKTIFNGNLFETKQIDFNKINMIAGGKTGFAEISIPIITSDTNYIEISTTDSIDSIVDYFVISLIDFDRNNFYTKDEINAKDIPTGKTTNSNNAYTLTTTLVDNYHDNLLCRVKINADSTGQCTFRCNNLPYKNIVDSNGSFVKKMKAGIWYHLCLNMETGNFILLGKGGGGTAKLEDVISGKTFTNDDDSENVGTLAKCLNIGSADGSDSENIINGSAYNDKVGRLDYKNIQKQYIENNMTIHIKNLLPKNIKKDVVIGGEKGIRGIMEPFESGTIIDMGTTNVNGIDLYFMGPSLTYKSSSDTTRDLCGIFPIGNKRFVALTEYEDTGASWNTYAYDFIVGSLSDLSGSISSTNTLGDGKYSSTSMFKVGNRIVVVSHPYSSRGDNQRTNKISLFNSNNDGVLKTVYVSGENFTKFYPNNISADGNYIYCILERNSDDDNYYIYEFDLNTGTNTQIGMVNIADAAITAASSVIVNGTKYYLVYGSGYLKVVDDLNTIIHSNCTSFVTFSNNKGIIVENGRCVFVEFVVNNGRLSYNILKQYSFSTSTSRQAMPYNNDYTAIYSKTEVFIFKNSDFSLFENYKVDNFGIDVLDGVRYKYRGGGSSGSVQVMGQPLYIKKL